MQADACTLGRNLGYVRNQCPQGGVRLCVDCILCDRNEIGSIFDLEFEWSPFQAIRNEVALDAGRFILGAFHSDDERMNLGMLAVIRYDVDNGCRIGLDEDFFFEGPCFHEIIIIETFINFATVP